LTATEKRNQCYQRPQDKRDNLAMEEEDGLARKHLHQRIEAELNNLISTSGRTEQPHIVGRLKAVRQAWQDYTWGEAERREREAALLREVERVDRQAARVVLETERLRRLKDEAMAAVRRLEPDLLPPASPEPTRLPAYGWGGDGDGEEDNLLHLNRDLWQVRETLLRTSGQRREDRTDGIRLTDLLGTASSRHLGESPSQPGPTQAFYPRKNTWEARLPQAPPSYINPLPYPLPYSGHNLPYFYPGPPPPDTFDPRWAAYHQYAAQQRGGFPAEGLQQFYDHNVEGEDPPGPPIIGSGRHRPVASPHRRHSAQMSAVIRSASPQKLKQRRGGRRSISLSEGDDMSADLDAEEDNTSNDAGDISSGDLSSSITEERRRQHHHDGRHGNRHTGRPRQAMSRSRQPATQPKVASLTRPRQSSPAVRKAQNKCSSKIVSPEMVPHGQAKQQLADTREAVSKMAGEARKEGFQEAKGDNMKSPNGKGEGLEMGKKNEELKREKKVGNMKREREKKDENLEREMDGDLETGNDDVEMEKEVDSQPVTPDQEPIISEPDQNYILGKINKNFSISV
jgi:hypothetical protein